MAELRIPSRGIAMLVSIKQGLLADNDLCMKVCRLGKLAMANYMDELIKTICMLETQYHDYKCTFLITKGTLDEIDNLMNGYTPDMLSDERLDEIKKLVNKWAEEDEQGDIQDGKENH